MCREIFHLWWHPRNFGVNLAENLRFLNEIIAHFMVLREFERHAKHKHAEGARSMKINKKILLLCGAGYSSAAIANAIIDRFGEIDILEETAESE